MEDRDIILNSKTPYQALFLPSTATPEEAKHQYFKLVRKFSPEKEEQCFRVIRKAYEDLKDPEKKAAADVMLFTGGRRRVRFAGVNSETASEVKINREIKEYSSRDLSQEENKKNLILAYKQKALLLSKNKKWQPALDCINELEKLTGRTQEIEKNKAFLLGRIAYNLADQGQYAEAALRWKRALRLDPDNAEILHNIAVCATLMINREEEEQYWVETLRAWHKDLSVKGDDPYLKNLIIETHKRFGGRFLRQTGDDSLRDQIQIGAEASSKTAHQVGDGRAPGTADPKPPVTSQETKETESTGSSSPVEASTHLTRGMDAYGKRNWKGAIASFELHLKEHPKDGEAWDKLAWALLHDNQGNRAFKVWEKMVKQGPESERALESLIQAKLDTARMLKKKMMFNPALAQLKGIQKLAPDSWEVYHEMGLIYQEKEDWPNAAYYFDKALEINPNEKTLRALAREAKTRARSLRARA